MRKTIRLLVVLSAVWSLGCGSRPFVRRFNTRSPGPPVVAGGPAESALLSTVREEGVLRLSPENTRITFVGSAGRVSHEGSFSRLAGRLVLPADDPKDARLEVEVDVDSVTTRIFLLTTHLKSRDFFDVAKYPGAKFVSQRIEPSTAPHATHLITGDLTIHGETRSLSFPARIVVTPYVVTLDATIPISQSEFGMERAARKTDDVVPVSVSSRIPRR